MQPKNITLRNLQLGRQAVQGQTWQSLAQEKERVLHLTAEETTRTF